LIFEFSGVVISIMLRQNLENRLNLLKIEFESGNKLLADLEAKQTNVRETLFRISGAIQVLEELLATTESTPDLPNGILSIANSDDLEPLSPIPSHG
jgi:hypothetical protein